MSRVNPFTNEFDSRGAFQLQMLFLLQFEAYSGCSQRELSSRLFRLQSDVDAVAIGHHELAAASRHCKGRLRRKVIAGKIGGRF